VKVRDVTFQGPDVSWVMQQVSISMSPEQITELEELTGRKIDHLCIAVSDLADLSDCITN